MKKSDLVVSHSIEIPVSDSEVAKLVLSYANKEVVQAQLTYNGKVRWLVEAKSKNRDAVSYFLGTEPEMLASKFDPTAMVANNIDGLWLVERLQAHLAESDIENKEDMTGEINRLTVVNSLMALHAVGFNTMVKLYGYNWVAEQSAGLIRQSQEWKAMVKAITDVQDALKEALSS